MENKWFDANEKLPPEGLLVLGALNPKLYFLNVIMLQMTENGFWSIEENGFRTVTHWMELPGPPMTEEE